MAWLCRILEWTTLVIHEQTPYSVFAPHYIVPSLLLKTRIEAVGPAEDPIVVPANEMAVEMMEVTHSEICVETSQNSFVLLKGRIQLSCLG